MDGYTAALQDEELVGIPLWAWQRFLSMFSQDWKEANVVSALETIERLGAQKKPPLATETLAALRQKLVEIADLVQGD